MDDWDLYLTSSSDKDSVAVRIEQFFKGPTYQHLILKTSDGATCMLVEEYPYVLMLKLDSSRSQDVTRISQDNPTSLYAPARDIRGSLSEPNRNSSYGKETSWCSGGYFLFHNINIPDKIYKKTSLTPLS